MIFCPRWSNYPLKNSLAKRRRELPLSAIQKLIDEKEPLELPVGSLLNLRPFVIYSIKLNNLEQKEKAKFNRHLYERKSQKYKYTGLLHRLNGKKLASGCVIVPNSQKEKIERYFKKYNASFDQIKVWK
jgi:hypothetical protein